jgi:DNA-binding MarR family transcriptional regulator
MAADYSPERLRDLFHRKALASERHRSAMARILNLSDTEAAALAYLARSGHLTPGQLGDALGMTSGGVTALTQRLVADGHIVKEPHPTDRRSMVLSATPDIIRAAEECFEPLVADMDRVASRLSEEEIESIGRFLEDVVNISERHAEQLASSAQEAQQAKFAGMPVPGLWA